MQQRSCCFISQSYSFTLAFLFLFASLSAQDLHIYYDAQKSTVRYESDGKVIKSPKVKKEANIFLHIENYNNYLYDLEVQANNQILQIPKGSGMSNIMGLIGGGANPMDLLSPGNFSSGAGEENWAPTDTGTDNLEDLLNSNGSGMVSAGSTASAQAFQPGSVAAVAAQTMQEMASLETQFSEIERYVENFAERKEIRTIVLEEVQKIKYNENLHPDQVKRMSMDFLSNILEVDAEKKAKLNLDTIIRRGDDRHSLQNKLIELEAARSRYVTLKNELEASSGQLTQTGVFDTETAKLLSTIVKVNEQSPQVLTAVEDEVETIKGLYKQAGKADIQRMTSIWYEYEALANNSFSHVYRTEASGDRTTLGVQFYRKDSLGNRRVVTGQEPVKINVPVYGGLKVNVSVGLNFGQFFQTPQDYFLKDTIITSEDTNDFVPIATSFIHFYPQQIKDVSIGGSFGIGIPLSGGEAVSSLNFFLGPSIILGKSQRVIINTGFMGGRVQEISQGLKVGDTLPPFSSVPTKSKYQMGYFLGISFNI